VSCAAINPDKYIFHTDGGNLFYRGHNCRYGELSRSDGLASHFYVHLFTLMSMFISLTHSLGNTHIAPRSQD
jgi:hypothetical protein